MTLPIAPGPRVPTSRPARPAPVASAATRPAATGPAQPLLRTAVKPRAAQPEAAPKPFSAVGAMMGGLVALAGSAQAASYLYLLKFGAWTGPGPVAVAAVAVVFAATLAGVYGGGWLFARKQPPPAGKA